MMVYLLKLYAAKLLISLIYVVFADDAVEALR